LTKDGFVEQARAGQVGGMTMTMTMKGDERRWVDGMTMTTTMK
jgi:hypothetical protein